MSELEFCHTSYEMQNKSCLEINCNVCHPTLCQYSYIMKKSVYAQHLSRLI